MKLVDIGPTVEAKDYLVNHSYNDAFTLTNRLLKTKLPVFWVMQPITSGTQSFAPGAFWIPASAAPERCWRPPRKARRPSATQ